MVNYARCVIGRLILEGRKVIGVDVVIKYFYRIELVNCVNALIKSTFAISFAYVVNRCDCR